VRATQHLASADAAFGGFATLVAVTNLGAIWLVKGVHNEHRNPRHRHGRTSDQPEANLALGDVTDTDIRLQDCYVGLCAVQASPYLHRPTNTCTRRLRVLDSLLAVNAFQAEKGLPLHQSRTKPYP
jgi:hypothetical protein